VEKIHNEKLNDLPLTQCCPGVKLDNEMGWTCSTYGREERRIQGFGGEP